MPTISFSYADFENLLGRSLSFEKFRDLALLHAKAEVDDYDGRTGEVKISLDDTNLPFLWSVEGMARFFRGVLGIETGLPKLKLSKSSFSIVVDGSVRKCRPHIAAFVAEGRKIDGYLLEQLIQLQEKFCEGYGRRREKVSIGLYSHKKIRFPVSYRAAGPDSVSFVPLGSSEEMKLKDVLKAHPKGKQYGWIIEKFRQYPVLMDQNGEVLSLVPVINSDFTGKLAPGDSEMLFEATGTDEDSVNLAASIFAQNLSERGFRISEVSIVDGRKRFKTPRAVKNSIKISPGQVESLTGLKLSQAEIKGLLERARYGVSGDRVEIPDFRRDILHFVDVVEDVAIMYGFNNMESAPLKSYTVGSPAETNVFADRMREMAVSMGFQEILSPVLSSKASMQDRMEAENDELVEIENMMSETYSAVRSWLTPVLLEVLSKNKHNDFPQKVFEAGTVNLRKGGAVSQSENIAFAVSHTDADFTEAKQVLDAVMDGLGARYSLRANSSGSFIKGRAGDVVAKGRKIGTIGEIAPKVLSNWKIEMPVVSVELSMTELRKSASDL